MKRWKVIVVMPAYNAAKTLEKTYREIPKGSYDEVLIVDDASRDNTPEVARKLGLEVIVHKKNLGYGGNQKTCYATALKKKADIVVMLHPDYQYDPKLLPLLVEPIKKGFFDVMLGSRIRSRNEALAGGMPIYKYISNRILTIIENVALGLNLSEYHTGYRAFSKEVLQKVSFHTFSNDFIFDTQILFAAHKNRFRIGEAAVPVKYFEDASSISFQRSLIYGLLTMWELVKYLFPR